MALSLVSVNVERSKHLELVLPFLRNRAPDVLCVQELMERDIHAFAEAAGAREHRYFQMALVAEGGDPAPYGIGIFSRSEILAHDALVYADAPRAESSPSDPSTFNDQRRALLWCDVAHEGRPHRIATTHFTWTPDGSADGRQRRDADALLAHLSECGEFVLTGDFNAPRGGEIFQKLASRYADNIPLHCETSIDVDLHRAGKTNREELLRVMVDGLFTTPRYRAADVELVFGVSDHAAVCGAISKG